MISVIIPIYNTEKYVHKCLTSLLNNTYSDFEIICVDDGSEDDSLSVLKQFQQKDGRVIVISQENGGVSKARNTGLAVAKGEYICFVDSDDWVHPQYLEALLCGIESTKAGISVVRFQEIYEYNQELTEEIYSITDSFSFITLEQLLDSFKLKFSCCGKIFKRMLVSQMEFKEGILLGEDTLFVLEYLSKLPSESKACIINEKLYYYFHERENSAIHTFGHRERLKLVDCFIQEMDHSKKWKKTFAIEGLKKLLNVRYLLKISHSDDSLLTDCKIYFERIFQSITIKEMSLKNYTIYRVFYLFPWTYRLFRILKDPTMIQAEKNLKSKYS